MHNLVNPKPQGSLEALKVNVNSALVLFENAVVIINSRMETPELFVMPDRLRDHMMALFCINQKYPVEDVSILYQSVITAALPQHTRNLPLPEFTGDPQTTDVLRSNLPLTDYTRNLRTIDVLSSEVDSTNRRINSLSARLREYVSLCELQLEDQHSTLLADFLEMNIEDIPTLKNVLTRVEFTQIVKAADASDSTTAHMTMRVKFVKLLLVEIEYKYTQFNALKTLIKTNLPNFNALLGPKLASTLIGMAGSVENLDLYTNNDLMQLGSSKLLPRATNGEAYGAIFDHAVTLQSSANNRNEMASVLTKMCLDALHVDLCLGAPFSDLGRCLLFRAEHLVNLYEDAIVFELL